MQAFWSWRSSVLAVFFGFTVPAAQAGMITITPDSIPNPPQAVSSANGTPVSPNNFVISQYARLGMNFNAPAITSLNGVSVWVPVNSPAGTGGSIIDYATSSIGGSFVWPGTSKALSPSSVTLDIIGDPSSLRFQAGSFNGMPLNITPVLQSTPGPDGGQRWRVTGSGIYSIYVSSSGANSPWGISEVSLTTASTPEPSSLVLAGLRALGLATCSGWRRMRRAA